MNSDVRVAVQVMGILNSLMVGTQTVNKRVNCGRLSDVRGLCLSQ